jgi:hypothetical protein
MDAGGEMRELGTYLEAVTEEEDRSLAPRSHIPFRADVGEQVGSRLALAESDSAAHFTSPVARLSQVSS